MRRQGQAAFRRSLFSAYRGRCAISRTSIPWILEAAHIVPYRGPKTNAVENGLLLRADFHTLFDLGLVAIDPSTMEVRTSSLLGASPYASVNGKALLQPAKVSERPSVAAITEHFKGFRT
jgi:predicted restriction endonuclease